MSESINLASMQDSSTSCGQDDVIVFTVECSDGQETYTHRPGRYCWRYIHNLVALGGQELANRQIDFSRFLTRRAVKLLERIFSSNLPIERLSTTTGFAKLLYIVETDGLRFYPRLSISDMDAVIDCLEYCVELDMRYRDASAIAEESKLLLVSKASMLDSESLVVASSRNVFLEQVESKIMQQEAMIGSSGPRGAVGALCAPGISREIGDSDWYIRVQAIEPSLDCTKLVFNGEAWVYEWCKHVGITASSPCVTFDKNPSQRCDDILPLVIFSNIVYSYKGREYWPVEQVLRAASNLQIVEAISDYMPVGFARTRESGHPLFPKTK